MRLLILLILAAASLCATPILIYSTGLDDLFAPLPDQSVDPHWIVNGGGPAYVTNSGGYPFGAWRTNPATAKWISPQPTYAPCCAYTDAQNSQFSYTTSFDLTGFRPATAVLYFRAAVDNDLQDVILNGTHFALTYSGYSAFSGPMTISSGFNPGINTLQFVTWNGSGPAGNPNGLLLEITGDVTELPEPALFVGTGLALLAIARFRRLRG